MPIIYKDLWIMNQACETWRSVVLPYISSRSIATHFYCEQNHFDDFSPKILQNLQKTTLFWLTANFFFFYKKYAEFISFSEFVNDFGWSTLSSFANSIVIDVHGQNGIWHLRWFLLYFWTDIVSALLLWPNIEFDTGRD